MITQKYKKQFTEAELNAYLQDINSIHGSQSAQVDEAWRQLGYINASAYKGHGAISDEQIAYNGMVYRTKEKAIVTLAKHTDNITSWDGVFYVRLLNGVQVSFHRGTIWNRNDQLDALSYNLRLETAWDGVPESYTYTDIEAYNEARAEYQRKLREDKEKKEHNTVMIHTEIHKFFKHHNTRKSYGLPTKKADWETTCKEAMRQDCFGLISMAIRNYGIHYYEQVNYIENIIKRCLPQGWNIYNFND